MLGRRVQHHRPTDRVVIVLANGRRLACPPVPPDADSYERERIFEAVLRRNWGEACDEADELWRVRANVISLGTPVRLADEIEFDLAASELPDEGRDVERSARRASFRAQTAADAGAA